MTRGRGTFKKLHADPVVRLETFIHRWCLSSGFEGHEAAVKTWAETVQSKAFKSALSYLDVNFSSPMTDLLHRYRAYVADQAKQTQM
ncbi:hypothetical protein [Pseudorhodoferax sp. Leaf267]|uniref:hypothetical protein n=1 Tax=Pseudorhodoferax sp. Leaf267 TaxID=1736316 RepID=UPI0006F66EC9|nr:hypothetical protein [Pseudorhodoferax sp. Leaf267]KQP22892.1 hypothetical protein ASF43_03095 [Pseudorhodoferax sp. Leaf267]